MYRESTMEYKIEAVRHTITELWKLAAPSLTAYNKLVNMGYAFVPQHGCFVRKPKTGEGEEPIICNLTNDWMPQGWTPDKQDGPLVESKLDLRFVSAKREGSLLWAINQALGSDWKGGDDEVSS